MDDNWPPQGADDKAEIIVKMTLDDETPNVMDRLNARIARLFDEADELFNESYVIDMGVVGILAVGVPMIIETHDSGQLRSVARRMGTKVHAVGTYTLTKLRKMVKEAEWADLPRELPSTSNATEMCMSFTSRVRDTLVVSEHGRMCDTLIVLVGAQALPDEHHRYAAAHGAEF